MMMESKRITLLALAVCCSTYTSHAFSTAALKRSRTTTIEPLFMARTSENDIPADARQSVVRAEQKKPSITVQQRRISKTQLRMSAAVAEPKPRKTRKSTKKSGSSSKSAVSANIAVKKQPEAGAPSQRSEMMNHEILTKEQEFELGYKVQRCAEIKTKMVELLETNFLEQQGYAASEGLYEEPISESSLYASGTSVLENGSNMMEDELSDMSVYSLSSVSDEETDTDTSITPFANDNQFWFYQDHAQNRRQVKTSMSKHDDELDDTLFTDDEIVHGLGLRSRKELRRILIEGALARDTLVRCNIRLVVSIAKKWSRQTAKMTTADGGHKLGGIYAGSSTRPSLDEAVQEGILGLAKASERYDASRELRFSTYATHWITNQVRICFQRASTGALRVPAPYHDIKTRYKKIVKKCVESNTPVPPEEEMAAQVGVTLNRLRKALHYTRRPISLDEPLSMGASKGSSAGGDGMGGRQVLVSDLLECDERKPDEQVELSLLRQCLENAMASELSPHERDVVRLRLGLDDGVARTQREVVDVCGGNISIAEVRNAEKRAYLKMSSPYAVHTRQLLSYLDFCGGDLETIRG